MQLEPPFLITESKLCNNLLILLPKDDKSSYLKLAGYEINNWPILKEDILHLAKLERTSEYGLSYSITGQLIGPNGRSVWVKTIWMKDVDEEITKFITLYPPK